MVKKLTFQSAHLATIDVKNQLGESILWRSSDSTVWWTDILSSKLYKMSWPTMDIRQFDLPCRLGSFGFIQGQDNVFITAFEKGFALYEPETSNIEWLSKPASLGNGIRLNDGRVGPDGRFWAGSMYEDNTDETALPKTGLFKLDYNGQAEFVRPGLNISNSICWDPSRNRIYYSDSAAQEIYHSTYDFENGDLGPQKLLLKLDTGHPDGAVVDKEGNLWVAIWGDSKLKCFDPLGQLLFTLPLPVSQPSCLTFGGADMNLLFITSAHTGLSKENTESFLLSGAVFVYETNRIGRDVERYTAADIQN